MEKLIDLLSKYQKFFLGMAIFLFLSAVSITIVKGQMKLNFQNYPVIMLLLVGISLLFILIYVFIDKYKLKNLLNQIKEPPKKEPEDSSSMLLELTQRQKEVYDLIVSGKTNKEIMTELFIEQSTLKSHINQIYKKLDIKNRKELMAKKHWPSTAIPHVAFCHFDQREKSIQQREKHQQNRLLAALEVTELGR